MNFFDEILMIKILNRCVNIQNLYDLTSLELSFVEVLYETKIAFYELIITHTFVIMKVKFDSNYRKHQYFNLYSKWKENFLYETELQESKIRASEMMQEKTVSILNAFKLKKGSIKIALINELMHHLAFDDLNLYLYLLDLHSIEFFYKAHATGVAKLESLITRRLIFRAIDISTHLEELLYSYMLSFCRDRKSEKIDRKLREKKLYYID